ncbi:hypothetical protein DM02DRAFT_611358 [Periconia macrospinosa]|uniref:Uncharacterized protein n=1 Tax=Periconia macrospinosa TaxID=97972 RepID=A0A2V1E2G3_9PLEO|nr:hypothetical protein DM02DRAFT_611358 [Periconia macrospinosa]
MASPSRFLTFYRHAVTSSSSRFIKTATRAPVGRSSTSLRRFGASAQCYKDKLSTDSTVKTDEYPDDKHTVEKVKEGDDLDVQSRYAKRGMEDAKKRGGHATEERDSAGGVSKAKKENPEAPDPAIGMQDERGSRGG